MGVFQGEVSARCACDVHRRTERDYWSLSEDMPVHEVENLEIDVTPPCA